jgi:hypothetical protein
MSRVLVGLVAGVAALLALASPQAAGASVVTVTFEGTVKSYDGRHTQIFGVPDAVDLAGEAYTAVYRFDTDVGVRNTSSTFDAVFGGSFLGLPTPFVSGSLTIGGYVFDLTGGTSDVVSTAHGLGFGRVTARAYYTDGLTFHSEVRHNIYTQPTGGTIGTSLEAFSTYLINPATDELSDHFEIQRDVWDDPLCCRVHGIYAVLLPHSVTFNAPTTGGGAGGPGPGGVPEPGAWALMLTGFAGIGFSLRRGRSLRSLAAARA